MPDIYLEYCTWFQHTYGRPFNVTREQWAVWCRAKPAPRLTDDQFDDAKEREGDAQ